jgi:hypothetical protein
MTYQVDVQPDIWTILTAVGTFGAVIAAMLGTWYGVSSGRRERRHLEDKEARAEARKVVVIPTHEYDNDEVAAFTREFVQIVNAGGVPILEARMVYGGSFNSQWVWMHGSGGSYTELVLPNDQHSFTGGWHNVRKEPTELSNAERGGLYGAVAWSDARDRHWVRRGRDQPVELAAPYVWGTPTLPANAKDNNQRVIQEIQKEHDEMVAENLDVEPEELGRK